MNMGHIVLSSFPFFSIFFSFYMSLTTLMKLNPRLLFDGVMNEIFFLIFLASLLIVKRKAMGLSSFYTFLPF